MVERERVHYKSIVADSARWEQVPLRPGDIVLSTPPKCGTTWLQRICSLLVFQSTELYEPLDLMSPWVDVLLAPIHEVAARLAAQDHRRFIKSHTPLDGLPFDPAVTYVTVSRDLRDVALSWDNHFANMNLMNFIAARGNAVGLDDIAELLADGPPQPKETLAERVWDWVDGDAAATDDTSSLRGALHHLQTFWDVRDEPNVVLLRYEDLKADLDAQMQALADRLGIDVPAAVWPELVDAATFDRMRERVHDIAPETTKSLWLDNDRFFHRGTTGQWRDLWDDADVRRYAARVAALAPADLAAWIHEHDPLPAV